MTTSPADRALLLHDLHRPGSPLVLPNAWDVASARIVVACGAAAVATTSAGVAWSLGRPDGDVLDRESAVAAVDRIAGAVAVPVTADVEGGFGVDPAGVAETVAGVLAAGAVGVNIEDSRPGADEPLRDVDDQCARLRAARETADAAGVRLFVNARVDTYLYAVGDPADRLDRTLRRAAAYRAAGADGIFVPGVADPETIGALVAGIDAPVNVLAGPGSPPVDVLAGLGVARVSLGANLAEAAYGLVQRAAREVLTRGSYDSLADPLSYRELNALSA
ncbi:isocitrate lyase/PEP mutase family protein [Micromonospora endolithica]|uniref:Isocitrate lyase/phosphoenolpyruvate mutase family protein n=1 Tax=Micromonospora endolithica TaxID=230091 RepID=A0A3A9ZLP7_9ACTN|nr:isocitrate lyase/phosphoenolpyruvate mutase family protein [Micromonospora endolithica]RKN49240.1 isocitrate lyase/phosphoenolpyruvate mutase family protein [Micromonospora endolithica]TWJ23415.1 2-methylisocitrate lyase-like PEP mutase family enzyme [Micromonospora endolithica]